MNNHWTILILIKQAPLTCSLSRRWISKETPLHVSDPILTSNEKNGYVTMKTLKSKIKLLCLLTGQKGHNPYLSYH